MALFPCLGGTYRFKGMAVDRDLSLNRAMSRTRILAIKKLHLPYTEEILECLT